MKIFLYNCKGHELVADTDVVAEAEAILKDYAEKGCAVLTNEGAVLEMPIHPPMPDEVNIIWPMAGG